MYKYYSIERPVAPGTYPKPNGNKVVEIYNYDERQYIHGVGKCWGWIAYKIPLSDEDQIDYELRHELTEEE